MLAEALRRAKQGDLKGFEDLYLLTCQAVYAEALSVASSDRQAQGILEEAYVAIYKNIQLAPEEPGLLQWMADMAYQAALDENCHMEPGVKGGALGDEKATTILIRIEERLGLHGGKKEKGGRLALAISILRILAAGLALGAAVSVFWIGGNWVMEAVDSKHPFAWVMSLSTPEDAFHFTGKDSKKEAGGKGKEDEEEHTVQLQLGGKLVTLSQDREVVKVEDGGMPKYHPAIQKSDGFTYYLPAGDRTKEELPEADPRLNGTLLRVGGDGAGSYEVIATGVDDFTLWGDKIYYVMANSGQVAAVAKDGIYKRETFSYQVELKDKDLWLVDGLGHEALPGRKGQIQAGDRIYQVDSGRIRDVEPAAREAGGYTFYLSDLVGEPGNEIRQKSVNGDVSFYRTGAQIDCICIAEWWVYFSAYMGEDSKGNSYSKLYRANFDGSIVQEIHGRFEGRLKNLYYFPEKRAMYGEYFPGRPSGSYGRIAVVGLDGKMACLEDGKERSQAVATGNDMLELVMVSGNQAYCLWNDCLPDANGDGGVVKLWSRPLALDADKVEKGF